MTNRCEAPKENQWSVEKSGVTCCVQVLQSNPLSKCLQAVLNKVQLQQIVCACDNYNRFNLVYFDTVKRTWWKPKNISIFGRSSCYVGLFGAAIFLGIFGGGIFSTVGYFWRRDIFGAPGHPRQAWHVSAACLAPAQLKGGCLLPEGSACDEYLLNLLTYPPTSWPYTPNHGGWWSGLNGDKLPDF